ncbi:universal stress protein [Agriterribacter sp.]|uniref:universal stress protein n=1 Tax=Agriterribacter sp. TaxID=2821509 RepID=UPI002BCEC3CE|nr:universal stress protein [Agriterribacter sp.]HTN07237.1 universal stress protein [Agriterribacter sp.]
MKTIIVPTDFSPVAINAMNYAVELAQAIDASVMLLHVFQMPVSYNNSDIPLPLMDIGELERINKERIDELKEQVQRVVGDKLTITAEVKLGDLVDELKTLCAGTSPFAVVMGTKGAGFVERLLVGSSTLSVIRHLTTPVLVVPPGAAFTAIQRIGFACDFKKEVGAIPAAAIKEWVKTFSATLSVLNVDDKKSNIKDTAEQSVLSYTLLQELRPKYFHIDNPDVAKGISVFAESNNLDLLIVIPRKHRLLDLLFQKSHTKELAFHSHIPILSVHEEE